MEGRKIKVFGVVMALLLAFSLAATFSVSSTVSAGTQKWTQISIPGTDDMQLAPGTDVGAIAVSPDGETLFTALFNQSTGIWSVCKSVDGGYTWKPIGFTDDGTDIVDICISPAWEDDDIMTVATASDAYYSQDRGKTFQSMGAAASVVGTIRSMDIALDEDGDATYVIGTSTDVYILSGFTGWAAQLIFDFTTGGYSAGANALGVLDVAFSPNYGEDGTVFAVVEGIPYLTELIEGTHLRVETDINVHNWGAYINDAHFVDQPSGLNIMASRACIEFPDDYTSSSAVFVGLMGYTDADGYLEFPDANAATRMYKNKGDAFRVDLVQGMLGTSAVTDLNIRGPESSTDVMSLAISGNAQSCMILAGLAKVGQVGPMSTWQAQVHYSYNGGEAWLPSYKPPSGVCFSVVGDNGEWGQEPLVLMSPDFEDSGIAYCATGYYIDDIGGWIDTAFSGVYVSTTDGTSFNGRGLLDFTLDAITDIVPSPDYDNDQTLFMVAHWPMAGMPSGVGLLWQTKDGGSHWENILGLTTMIPLPGCSITKIEIATTYPDDPTIFVTGPTALSGVPTAFLARSTDEGNLFATTVKAPYLAGVPQPIRDWVVLDPRTLIVAGGPLGGVANKIWKTTDEGAHWIMTDDTDISTTESIVDMKIYDDTTVIVGTDQGKVYICEDWENDFSFSQVGTTGPGVAGDYTEVVFDTNFGENGMIYAGIEGTNQGIWRIDANSDDQWEQIFDDADIYSIQCDGNGILWAISDVEPVREVNPTAPIDDINFEYVTAGLTSYLWMDLETAPTQTYVFAIGTADGIHITELWAYIDTIIKPTLTSPACGTTAAGTIIQGSSTARVSLMWQDIAKATNYDYEVAYDDEFGSIASSGTLEGTQVSVSLFLGEQYYWRVRVNGSVMSQWSEVCSFTTPLGPASAKPVVTYPGAQDSHTNIELTPSLTWTSAVEATGFELVLAENCDWAHPVINLTGSSALEGTDTCYAVTQTLKEGTNYCWKVRAVNSDTDTMSPWSDTGTFTTLVTPEEEEEGTPMWVWVVIALSAVLLVGVVVLIIRTRRPV